MFHIVHIIDAAAPRIPATPGIPLLPTARVISQTETAVQTKQYTTSIDKV